MTGAIIYHSKAEIPAGFLLCDGSAVSRSAYAALFALVGTTFGSGDGSTTFNVPDLRGRVVFGYKSSETEFDALGETGGQKTINLAHSHTMADHYHAVSGTSSAGPSETKDGNQSETLSAAGGHTHPFSFNTSTATGITTDSQLSSTQSVMSKYMTLYPIIKT